MHFKSILASAKFNKDEAHITLKFCQYIASKNLISICMSDRDAMPHSTQLKQWLKREALRGRILVLCQSEHKSTNMS